MDYNIGFTGCYIKDHNFGHVMDVSESVAVELVKSTLPDSWMGAGCLAKNLTSNGNYKTDASGDGWLNKFFVIIGYEHGKFIAIYKHDDRFALSIQHE